MFFSHKSFFSTSRIWIAILAFGCQACGWNPLSTKEDCVRRGREFAAQGRSADAILQYRKALQKDPSYGEAYLSYGRLLLKLNNRTEAFQYLSKAAELMPASDPVKVELGNLAISGFLANPTRPQKYYETAGKIAKELLAKDPNSFEGLRLTGLLAMADRHNQQAIDNFRKALQVKPNQADVIAVLVQTLLADGQGNEAEATARNALLQFKDYGPLYDGLYSHLMATQRPLEAEQLLKLKIANNPKVAFYSIQLADHYWGQKKPAEAEALLQSFLSQSHEYRKAPMDVGDFYRRVGRRDEAVALYQRGMESDRADRKDYLTRIAGVRMEQSRHADAAAAIDSILKDYPDDPDALAARADLRMASGKPEEIQKALEEFNNLVKKSPDNNGFRFSLARALRQTGQQAQARAALAEILRRDANNPNALREIADLEIRNQKPDEALQYAERLIALEPNNVGARLVRTSAWALRGRQNEVRVELRRIIAERPDLLEPSLQMATLEMDQGNYTEAEKIYLRLRAAAKLDIRPLRGLVSVYQSQRQPRKALDLVQQEAKRSTDVQVRVLLASAAALADDLELALSTAEAIARDFPQDPDHLVFLGQMQKKRGRLDQAIHSFGKARQLAPTNGMLAAHHGLALMEAGRTQEGLAALRESTKLQPQSPILMNNLAWHLAAANTGMDEAQALAQRAIQLEPSNAAFKDTLGVIFLKAGKPDNALQVLEPLVRKESNSATFRLHLARAMIGVGQRDKARIELQTALRNRPSPAETEEIQKLVAGFSN